MEQKKTIKLSSTFSSYNSIRNRCIVTYIIHISAYKHLNTNGWIEWNSNSTCVVSSNSFLVAGISWHRGYTSLSCPRVAEIANGNVLSWFVITVFNVCMTTIMYAVVLLVTNVCDMHRSSWSELYIKVILWAIYQRALIDCYCV